jgi:hypothetical protein
VYVPAIVIFAPVTSTTAPVTAIMHVLVIVTIAMN